MARAGLSPSARRILRLTGACPHVPVDVLAELTDSSLVAVYQLLARLMERGLVQVKSADASLLCQTRKIGMWSLSDLGRGLLERSSLGALGAIEVTTSSIGCPALRSPSLLIATYSLLAGVVAFRFRMGDELEILSCYSPWWRTFLSAGRERMRRLRLPGAATVKSSSHNSQGCGQLLLLIPDVGTASVASHRALVQNVIEFRNEKLEGNQVSLVVATSDPDRSGARVDAWQEVLDRAKHVGSAVDAQVFTWDQLAAIAPRVRYLRLAAVGTCHPKLAEQAFALIAQHPLLSQHQLARLLGAGRAQTAAIQRSLTLRRWTRPMFTTDIEVIRDQSTREAVQQLELSLITPTGQRAVGERLLLSSVSTRRRAGLLSLGPATRRRLFWQLRHTIGANEIMVKFATAARAITSSGGDDELVEWRSAAACARGGFRPDGYGCYRRGPARFGFFLEYDRGTERDTEYAAKLAAYYRYRDAGHAARDYCGFPTVLFVSISDRAEERFARQAYLASLSKGRPMPILLTTMERVASQPKGVLGQIWRKPFVEGEGSTPVRIYWLPHLLEPA